MCRYYVLTNDGAVKLRSQNLNDAVAEVTAGRHCKEWPPEEQTVDIYERGYEFPVAVGVDVVGT